jgi:muramidase (phage lysozyme)
MRFNSIGRQGNYSQAGKAVADDALNSFLVARRKSPDYGKIAQDAANIAREEKINSIKAQAEVTKLGIAAAAGVKAKKIDIKAKSDLKSATRKAGVLAAGGQMIQEGASYLGNERTKRNVGETDSDYTARITRAQSKIAELDKKIEELGMDSEGNFTGGSNSGGLVEEKSPGKTVQNTGDGLPKNNGSTTPKFDGGITGQGGGTVDQPVSGGTGWQRLSKVLRYGEGTTGDAGYTTQFTGTQFSDMSKHPRQLRSSGNLESDAAGAYQFLSSTWDEAKSALNLPDFSRESQEKAGRFLTKRRGVNPDQVFKTKEEFKGVMDKLAPEWASMPYSRQSPKGYGNGSSYYGQGGISLDKAWSLYNS